jgi:hypothetical protein
MQGTGIRTAIWNALLTADLNVRYWFEIRNSYNRRDVTTKIFLAATSSSTVATWGIWAEIGWLWRSLSAASALLAVALPILNWTKKIADMADLHGAWVQIRNQYDALWRRMESNQLTDSEVEAAFESIQTREAQAESSETRISARRNAKLIEKCYREVLRSRNLPLPST